MSTQDDVAFSSFSPGVARLVGRAEAEAVVRGPAAKLIVVTPIDMPETEKAGGDDMTEKRPGPETTSPGIERPSNTSPGIGRPSNTSPGIERPGTTSPGIGRPGTSSLPSRVATGAAAALAAVVAFSAGPVWVLLVVLAVVLVAAVEVFDAFRRVGHRPASLLALLGVVGVVLGSYAEGLAALPLIVFLVTVFSFLWYLVGVIRGGPTVNVAVTLLGFVWTGFLGAYAALLLRLPNHHGMAFLGGAVVVTAVYDTAAYLGGNLFGKHLLAPSISPGKTWEGAIAGTVAALVTGMFVVGFMHPWHLLTGAALGMVAAVVAPLGDLVESMVKRDLGVKDMGRLLPGHGGVLDRFDALLFMLPATYYLVYLLKLV